MVETDLIRIHHMKGIIGKCFSHLVWALFLADKVHFSLIHFRAQGSRKVSSYFGRLELQLDTQRLESKWHHFFFFKNWYGTHWYCWPCTYLMIQGYRYLEFRGYEIASETIFGTKKNCFLEARDRVLHAWMSTFSTHSKPHPSHIRLARVIAWKNKKLLGWLGRDSFGLFAVISKMFEQEMN